MFPVASDVTSPVKYLSDLLVKVKVKKLEDRTSFTRLWLVLAFRGSSEEGMNNKILTTTESWNKTPNIAVSSHFYLYWFLQSPELLITCA